jgi:hypothetical protein
MKTPNIKEFESSSEVRYQAILELQEEINKCLKEHYVISRNQGRKYLASTVITKVEDIVKELNQNHYDLYSIDYGGDINYENSEQWYRNGPETGQGLVIHFLGFTSQVSWDSVNA